MDPDWTEVATAAVPPGPHLLPTAATALAFDDAQELLWAGTEFGRISSFFGPDLARYTSLRAHPGEGPVRQILPTDRGVLSLASRSLHLASRRGLTRWHLALPEMEDCRCMALTAAPGSVADKVLIAGCQSVMFIVDFDRGAVVERIPTAHRYTLLRRAGRYLCAATDGGHVHALSLPGSNGGGFHLVKSWKAHGAAVADMDAHGDFLVTCGFSARPALGASLLADPLASVYDLKALRPLAPIPFHAGAAAVRMHPKLQTTAFVASQSGQMQVIDLMNPAAVSLRHAGVALLLGLEVAPSGEAVAIADADAVVRLWGSPSRLRFNEVCREPTEMPDIPAGRLPAVHWWPSSSTPAAMASPLSSTPASPAPSSTSASSDPPLSLVGMPYYHDRLLSAWPSHLVFDLGSPPAPIDPQLKPYLRPGEMGLYGPNPRKTYRYQADSNRSQLPPEPPAVLLAPRFLSEKARAAARAVGGNDDSSLHDYEDPLLKYSNVEIKYSKFGVDDFDFGYYNRTEHSGLETHIANSFINALLQLLNFTPLIRNIALHHVAADCLYMPCLLCELGFFFDMLDKAHGQSCQATNLLRTFSSYREAVNLGLLEENLMTKTLPSAIQSVHRFFLGQVTTDYYRLLMRNNSPLPETLDRTLITSATEAIRCIFCRSEIVRPVQTCVTELVYPPPIDLKHLRRHPLHHSHPPVPPTRFSHLLKAGLEREAQNRGWCSACRRYQQLAIRRAVARLPAVLSINAAIAKPHHRGLWSAPGFVPDLIGVALEEGRVQCFEGDYLTTRLKTGAPGIVPYELVGVVAEVDIPEHHHKPHLVSFVNVSIAAPCAQATRDENQWHLFNDFLVTPVSREEALSFGAAWKTPCVLTYQVASARHAVDSSWRENLDPSLLFRDWSLNGRPPTAGCVTLQPEERPVAGMPVALDTEFVDLEKAEIEAKADGTREMVRPSKSGLARVSVVRGAGERAGMPFIDDYITISEPVVDYVTPYSGIKPGDLDPRTSVHNLVPLKIAYKKLWLLLNLNCIFVGHGLASDFRKINIQVPRAQTVDTQYLFFHPAKNRRLSLRYLAWAVFREFIQDDPPAPTLGQAGAAVSTSVSPPPPTTSPTSPPSVPATPSTPPTPVRSATPATPATPTQTQTQSAAGVAPVNSNGHDSIEDARMALRLWRRFCEFQDAGVVGAVLEEIFRVGLRLGFRPPRRSAGAGVGVGGGAGVGSGVPGTGASVKMVNGQGQSLSGSVGAAAASATASPPRSGSTASASSTVMTPVAAAATPGTAPVAPSAAPAASITQAIDPPPGA